LHSSATGEKWEYNETVNQLFVDFKKAYDSVRRKVLYSILLEFGVPMKLVRLIKMCLNETYSKIYVGKHLFVKFHVQNNLKQGDALLPLLFKNALEYAIRKVQGNCSTRNYRLENRETHAHTHQTTHNTHHNISILYTQNHTQPHP
jgi:hypothetical protein